MKKIGIKLTVLLWVFFVVGVMDVHADVAKGKTLLNSKSCMACHSVGGKGGEAGPPLDSVGTKRNEKWLRAHLTDPSAHKLKDPASHKHPGEMPKSKLTEQEMIDLIDYLLTLK